MPVLLLTLETLLFIAIDRKMYGTFYTPTIFLSVPYLCIVFVFILFADNFNFYSLYLPSVYIWCIGLALYWLVGYQPMHNVIFLIYSYINRFVCLQATNR